MTDDTWTRTIGDLFRLLGSALWHPAPALLVSLTAVAVMLAAPWGQAPLVALLGFLFLGAITAWRLRDPELQAVHEGLDPLYLDILRHRRRLDAVLAGGQGLGPATVARLTARVAAMVDEALTTARTLKRLGLLPMRSAVDDRVRRIERSVRDAGDETARRELDGALAAERSAAEATERAHTTRQRSRARLAHVAAVLQSLQVRLLALDGSQGGSDAASLDELLSEAECLDAAHRSFATASAPAASVAALPSPSSLALPSSELTPDEVFLLAAAQAARDGSLSPDERRLLQRLASLLGLDASRAATLLRQAAALPARVGQGALDPGELFEQVLTAARRDQVLAPAERALVLRTARALGLSPGECEEIQQRVVGGLN